MLNILPFKFNIILFIYNLRHPLCNFLSITSSLSNSLILSSFFLPNLPRHSFILSNSLHSNFRSTSSNRTITFPMTLSH